MWFELFCGLHKAIIPVNLVELQQSQSDISTAVTPKSALIHSWVAPIHLSALWIELWYGICSKSGRLRENKMRRITSVKMFSIYRNRWSSLDYGKRFWWSEFQVDVMIGEGLYCHIWLKMLAFDSKGSQKNDLHAETKSSK